MSDQSIPIAAPFNAPPCDCCRAKDELLRQLADHLTAASEVLSQLALRDGRVSEIVRLRSALERIANDNSHSADIAKEALRWTTAIS